MMDDGSDQESGIAARDLPLAGKGCDSRGRAMGEVSETRTVLNSIMMQDNLDCCSVFADSDSRMCPVDS